MPLDAVLFDLGNVFAFHDNELLFERLAEAFRSDRVLVGQLVESLSGEINRGRITGEALHRRMEQRFAHELSFEHFAQVWSSHFTVNDEAVQLAESLDGKLNRVLVSNTNALHWDWLRPRLPVLERFDALVLSHEVGFAKPDRAIYDAALRLSGARPGRALFLDDVLEYVEAARATGLQAEVFTTADAAREAIERLG